MKKICKEGDICGKGGLFGRHNCDPGTYVTGIKSSSYRTDNYGLFGGLTITCSDDSTKGGNPTKAYKDQEERFSKEDNKNSTLDNGWNLFCPNGIKRVGMNFGSVMHRFGYTCAGGEDAYIDGYINISGDGDQTSIAPEGQVLTGVETYDDRGLVSGVKLNYGRSPTPSNIKATESLLSKRGDSNNLKPYMLLSVDPFLYKELGSQLKGENKFKQITTPGKYPNMNSVGMTPNTISSIYVTKGAIGTFYRNPGLSGDSLKIMGPAYIGYLERIGWDDIISSFIFTTPKNGEGKYISPLVTLYGSFNLSPNRSFVSITELGSYPNVEIIGFDNNVLNSLYVSSGVRVILYSEQSFGGTSVTITGPKTIDDIKDAGFPNNALSSLIVQLIAEDTQSIVTATIPIKNNTIPVCPKIGGTNGRPVRIGDNIKCSYNVNNFKDGNDIDIWLNPSSKRDKLTGKSYSKWNENNTYINKNWDEKIMPDFCSQTSTSCPPGLVDPKTKKPTSICSNFVSTDNNGNKCREWVDTQIDRNSTNADSAMIKYCTTKDYTPDCLCITPGRDTSQAARFLEETLTNKTPKACWWVPCGDPANYAVPVKDPRFQAKGKCPTVSCNQYTKILGNQNTTVDIGSIKSYINCNATIKDGEVTLDKKETGTVQQNNQTTNNKTTNNNKPNQPTPKTGIPIGYIVASIAVLLIVISIIIFFIIRSRRSK